MNAAESFETLLRTRHSCRAFLDKPIARSDIERIIRIAGRVPSWCNAQPWKVVVTDRDETQRLRIALHAHMQVNSAAPDIPFPAGYSGQHKERRRACGFQLYDAVGIETGDRVASAAQMMENFNFFGAPHVAIISSGAELSAYGAMDCGGFVSAFTLAAQALGIASIPQASIASYAPLIRSHFGFEGDRLVLYALSLGYEDTDHPANNFRTERAEIDEIMEWKGVS